MSNSVASSTFMLWYNHYFYLIPKHLHHSKRKPIPIKQSRFIFFSPQALETTSLLSLWIYLVCIFHIIGIMQYKTFCVWLFLLGLMFLRFIHRIVCVSTPLFLLCWNKTIPYYVYPPVCLSILPLVNICIVSNFGYCEECCYEYACARIYLSSFHFFWVYTYLWNDRQDKLSA